MDRSLLLLLALRGRAWGRLWVRNLGTLKGVLLALVGSLVFLPLAVSALLVPRVQTASQLDAIRRYGPLGLLAYCVLNVVLSSGDRAVTYSPAEVNFLFCGPYRPRQLLLYKVGGGLAAGAITSLIMAFVFRAHAASFPAAYCGLFLALQFLYLFSLAVGLAVSTAGALAFGLGRKMVLTGVAAVAVAAVVPVGAEALALPPGELVGRALRSRAVSAVVWPLHPFARAFTAESIWPDLVGWSAAAAAVDAAMLGLVLGLNARFLEASAAASARVDERVRKARRGAVVTGPVAVRGSLPMLPWWGGVGPVLWRQLTTASRAPLRVAAMPAFYVLPVAVMLLAAREEGGKPPPAGPLLSVFLTLSFIASNTVGFDFRPDLGRMEALKTLPVRPTQLVLGQLVTPVVILTVSQWMGIGLIAVWAAPDPGIVAAAAAFAAPGNLILVAVENLYFLWFPYRAAGVNSFDFQAMGRQLLLLLGKVVTVGLASGLAVGAGFAAWFLSGRSLAAAAGAAWAAALACGLALLPLVALAFDQFDVAGDRPE